MISPARRAIRHLAWLGLLTGLALGAVSFLPFDLLKRVGDGLSRDGRLESFTFERYLSLVSGLRWAGLAVLAASGLARWQEAEFGQAAVASFGWISAAAGRLARDAVEFWGDLRRIPFSRGERIALGLLVLVGLALRAAWLAHPIEYDEAYTYIEFARYSPAVFLRDYHVPNNHIFHTLLVYLSTQMFGSGLAAIRLPALLAGLALIPLTALLGRAFYSRRVGLLAAGLVSVYPLIVEKSASARGYIVIAALTAAMFCLAVYVRRHSNLFGWVLLGLVGSLGFYTVPAMLYPAGAVFTWLGLSTFVKQTRSVYHGAWRWLIHVVLTGAAMGLFSLLLYLPVIQDKGLVGLLTGSGFVKSLSLPDFVAKISETTTLLLREWLRGLPVELLVILAAGVAAAIVFHGRQGSERVSLQGAFAISLPILLLVQRPGFLERIWLWLLPFLLVQSAAGWLGLADLLTWPKARRRLGAVLMVGLLAATATAATLYTLHGLQNWDTPLPMAERNFQDSTPEHVVRFLKDRVAEDDIVVVSNCTDAQYWYHWVRYGLPEPIIRKPKNRPFSTAYVIVLPTCQDETIEIVVGKAGPDQVFLDLQHPRLLAEIGAARVVQVESVPSALEKAFPKK